jgi:DNA-binding IclR family transcriptional regulator
VAETAGEPERQGKTVPAVRRAAAILSALAAANGPMNLSEVARSINILPSSCLHILRELAATRLVACDLRTKTYRLGPKLVELARAALRQDPLAELVQPHLNSIASTYGVTATASAVSDDNHMVLIAFAHPPVSMSLNVTLGGRVPLMSGAAGRCLAAFENYSRSDLRTAFSKVRWQMPLEFAPWLFEVETVRRTGYSIDRGAFTKGVTTIAVPVRSADGSIRCVIGVGVISAQLESPLMTQAIAALKRAALEIGS